MNYAKTEAGQHALKERSPLLSTRQRSALILFDGRKSLTEVQIATATLGVTAGDIDYLLAQGFIQPVEGSGTDFLPTQPSPPVLTAALFPPVAAGQRPSAVHQIDVERYARAYPIAVQLAGGLGLRGFRLTLAVEAAAGYHELVALLPRLTEAVGPDKVRGLRQALGLL